MSYSRTDRFLTYFRKCSTYAYESIVNDSIKVRFSDFLNRTFMSMDGNLPEGIERLIKSSNGLVDTIDTTDFSVPTDILPGPEEVAFKKLFIRSPPRQQ